MLFLFIVCSPQSRTLCNIQSENLKTLGKKLLSLLLLLLFVNVAAMPEENAQLMLCGSSLSGSTDTERAVFSPCVLRGALFPPPQKATHSPRHARKLNSDIRVPLPTRQFPMMCLAEPSADARDSDDGGPSGSRRNEATERGFPHVLGLASNPCQHVKRERFSVGGN